MNIKDNLNKFNKMRTFNERSLGINLRIDTDFISGSRTLDCRLWTLDVCLWTLDLCSLLVDYGHVYSGLWTRDSGLGVLDTSLSGIFNPSIVMVDTSRRDGGGGSVDFISEDF